MKTLVIGSLKLPIKLIPSAVVFGVPLKTVVLSFKLRTITTTISNLKTAVL
jgi:hypothetical protein